MNERIRELAGQAGIGIWGDAIFMLNPKDVLDSTTLEKFAELIVQELVSTIEVEYCDFYHNNHNSWGVITVKYFVSGDPHDMRGTETEAEYIDGIEGTGRYKLNENFVRHLMKQHFGVE